MPRLKGRNFAIVTHAGGPGVMLTDALSKGGLNVPKLEGEIAEELKARLFRRIEKQTLSGCGSRQPY